MNSLNVKVFLVDDPYPINLSINHELFNSWFEDRCVRFNNVRENKKIKVYIPFERIKEIIVEDKL